MAGLRIERDGHVLRITLAKPERRNAFDAALIRELTEAFADVGDARAVVLAGDGESFCAGADIEWQRSAIDLTYEENVEDAMRLYRMCETIETCHAPVVARVQGYALGGGSGLVACADVAIATPDATFGFSEVTADLDNRVDGVVAELSSAGPEAVREAKRLIRDRPTGEETAQIAARLREGDEGQEGLRAFLERRPGRLPDGNSWGVYSRRG